MMNEEESRKLYRRNYMRVREMVRASWAMGVNLHKPTPFRNWMRVINVLLIFFSILSVWQHWIQMMAYIGQVDKTAETICTALQINIAVTKLLYYLFNQHRIHVLLNKVLTHELLQDMEIFETDFPELDDLRVKIHSTMEVVWRNIRIKLLYHVYSCSIIMCNYFITGFIANVYNVIKGTPDYVGILPFTGNPIWPDKPVVSWTFLFETFISACALMIAGTTAVSFDNVFLVLVMHGVGLFEVVNLLFERSTSPAVPPERRVEYMRLCIRQYQKVYNYVEEVNQIFLHMSLSQFLQSLILFAFLLFIMNVGLESDMVTAVRMMLYIAAAFNQLIIYGVNGQRLTSITDQIPMALYKCDWYNESREFKQLIHMMIHRTNRTYYLQISWFSTMTLATLVTVFKGSGSYFLLLRDVR